MELHYSITKKGDKMWYHGTFRHIGPVTRDHVRENLAAAIRNKWNFPYAEIEEVEYYYFENGKEIVIE